MRKFFLTVLVIVAACSSSNQVPDDLIPPEQMIEVLTEVHLLESKIKNLTIRPVDSAKRVYDHFEGLIFEEFNITEEQYQRSFNYYIDHTDDFSKIYTAVVDSLMQREKLETK